MLRLPPLSLIPPRLWGCSLYSAVCSSHYKEPGIEKDSMPTCPSNPASGREQACPLSSSHFCLFLEDAGSFVELLLRFSVVLPFPCLFVICSAKQLLIQSFTVDKQIQKINRCVLQMSLTKITSLVTTQSIRGRSKKMLFCTTDTPTSSSWNLSSQGVNRFT